MAEKATKEVAVEQAKTPARKWKNSATMPFHLNGLLLHGEPVPLKLYLFNDAEVEAFQEKYPDRAHYWEPA